ncbi:MAG: hypothetical protein K6E17_01410 [Clostridiales bacterium]|nr:hypothetical protein [Clostridiales bacterium]
MSKYSATFHIGWMTVNAEGDTPADLVREIENAQDLQCLVKMASMMGTKKDKKEIGRLIEFLEKYNDGTLAIDDVKNLNVSLSVGTLKCECLSEK